MVVRKEDEARTVESLQQELMNAKKEAGEYPVKIENVKKLISRGLKQKEYWTKIHPLLVEGCNVVHDKARLEFETNPEFRELNKKMQVLKNETEMERLETELENLRRTLKSAEAEVERYSRRVPELEEAIASKQD